jgi:hypothetical protein
MLASSRLDGLEGIHMVGLIQTYKVPHLLGTRPFDGAVPLEGEIPKVYGKSHVG